VAWTLYTYDASGRTARVKAPDGSVTQTDKCIDREICAHPQPLPNGRGSD